MYSYSKFITLLAVLALSSTINMCPNEQGIGFVSAAPAPVPMLKKAFNAIKDKGIEHRNAIGKAVNARKQPKQPTEEHPNEAHAEPTDPIENEEHPSESTTTTTKKTGHSGLTDHVKAGVNFIKEKAQEHHNGIKEKVKGLRAPKSTHAPTPTHDDAEHAEDTPAPTEA